LHLDEGAFALACIKTKGFGSSGFDSDVASNGRTLMPLHTKEVPLFSREQQLDHIFDDLFAAASGITLPK
jgi:hypothetical protein